MTPERPYGTRSRKAAAAHENLSDMLSGLSVLGKAPFSTGKLKVASTVEAGIYPAGETDTSMSQLAEELGHLKNPVTYPA